MVKEKWKEGYRIVNMEYAASEWFLIFAHMPEAREELFANNEEIEDFRKTIKKNWKRGYMLVDVANGRD